MDPEKPLVFRGILGQTRAFKNWSVEKFRREFGEELQPAMQSTKAVSPIELKTMRQIIDLQKSTSTSASFGDLIQKNARLQADLEVGSWSEHLNQKDALHSTTQFFLSPAGAFTKTHAELGETFSCQVVGKKTWYLVHPKYSAAFDPPVNWQLYLRSDRLGKMDEALSESSGLEYYEITLGPGDVLYCPSLFWHFVRCEDESISVGIKSSNLRNLVRHPFLSLILATSRNPSILQRKRSGQQAPLHPSLI